MGEALIEAVDPLIFDCAAAVAHVDTDTLERAEDVGGTVGVGVDDAGDRTMVLERGDDRLRRSGPTRLSKWRASVHAGFLVDVRPPRAERGSIGVVLDAPGASTEYR